MKYWVYLNGEVPGCYQPEDLVLLPGFSAATLVCPAEGDIEDKNWRRAGEFVDVIKAAQSQREPKVPLAAMSEDALKAANAEEFLDSAGTRLFRHVSDLVGEIERFRETKDLATALQKQLVEVREELRRSEAEKEQLKGELGRITVLEEAARKAQEERARLESEIAARQKNIEDLRLNVSRAASDSDAAKRRLEESLKHLGIRNKLVEKLSHDLAEKEMSLAKALDVIRRLEGEMERILARSGKSKDDTIPTPVKSNAQPSSQKVRSIDVS